MRDFNDPEYKKWRADVKRRDKYKCRKCGVRKKLQVHHIKSWSHYPQSRFLLQNGITLCRKCHGQMWGAEELYERQCHALLTPKSVLADILKAVRDMGKKDEI